MTTEAIAAWHAPTTGGKRGGRRVYSDLASETGLTLRLVVGRRFRQTEGAIGSIADFLRVAIRLPDHTTLRRRGNGLKFWRILSGGASRCIFLSVAPDWRFTAKVSDLLRNMVGRSAGAGVNGIPRSSQPPKRSATWN